VRLTAGRAAAKQ